MRTRYVLTGLVFALAFTAILAPRLIGIKKFTTGDEPAWLIFSSNFLHAIDKGQFERTVYEYHPAVTTMWVISAGILSYFPEYIQVRHGYIEKFWELDDLYARYGKVLSTVLYRSRMINAGIVALTLLVAFALLYKLLGIQTALLAVLLVSFDPFYLGQSRLLNHEGMNAAFTLVAILALLVFLNQGQKARYLLLSGVATGLALLTKSPTILLIPLAGLMFVVSIIDTWRQAPPQRRIIWKYIRSYLLWLGVLALVYVALWPGMWVAPGQMLYDIYGNAFSYALQGQRLQLSQELNPSRFGLESGGIGFYVGSLLFKTTPILWAGVLLAGMGLFSREVSPLDHVAKQTLAYLFIIAGLVVLMFGIARGRNSLHYITVSFTSLEVIAAIGFVWGCTWLGEKVAFFKKPLAQAGLLGALVLLQVGSGLPQYPYYYTYTNPVMQALQPGKVDPAAGYGEGLELAGAYLSQKPGAKKLTVTSHLGIGPFSYYFSGLSHPLMYQNVDYLTDLAAQWVDESDYLVIYDVQQKPINLPSKLLAALQGVLPEHVITINGIRYASIYKISELPVSVLSSLLPPK
jgi:4-amino-4-deoxy-L-arabinose transferase-like glycosyltransferase